MSRQSLDQSSFESLLDTHGAKLEQWPPDLAAAARQWLERSPEARAALQAASHVERLLEAMPDVEPSARLMARVAAIPVNHPERRAHGWPSGFLWAPVAAWALAGALGFVVGSAGLPVAQILEVTGPVDPAQQDQLFEGADEWSELSELALATDWAQEDE